MVNKCTICNSDNISVDKAVVGPYINRPYKLYKCQSCKSYFFDCQQHDVDLKDLYNFDSKNHSAKFSPRKYWAQEVASIKELLQTDKQSLNILDIGCRTGDFLLHWKKENALYGVELNAHNAEIAKNRGLNIYCDFIENIDFKQKFDVITCYALLEHIASPSKILTKIKSLLADGGILVILVPSIESKLYKKLAKKNIHWHMFTPPEHLSFYSRHFLDNFMQENNLNLVARRHTSGGLMARYSILSPFYKFLKNPSFNKLQEYYKSTTILKSGFLHKLQIILDSKSESFLTKQPYYDHMFSYYKKDIK